MSEDEHMPGVNDWNDNMMALDNDPPPERQEGGSGLEREGDDGIGRKVQRVYHKGLTGAKEHASFHCT